MRLFSLNKPENVKSETEGLYVSVEDLIAQQKFLPYLSLRQNQPTTTRAGDVKSAFKGRGMEIEEVRAYAYGDDIRDINWRITARKSEPFTKLYSEEKDRVITVFLDLTASMVFGTKNELKSVTASKIAALLGWLSIHNKDRFSLLIYDGVQVSYFKPQNNYKNLMVLFNKIAESSQAVLQNSRFGDMAEALKVLEFNQKGQGTIFILSDFYKINNEQFKKIAALSKRNRIYCVHIFDVLEEVAPAGGQYAAVYDGQKVVFDSTSDRFKLEYQRYFALQRENLKKNCQKFLCKYIEIRTDVPIFKQLRLI